ncbi:transcriptional regulator [Candidatus Saccharibacteria bacterium]|nr:transcriptional regulator [Candidatus Saccharibacteria bacterium]NCU40370.1 transcriptional regulator [Candidatus Saccharibacteria bacterium]
MIDALFGSKTRVKLLHLFLNNPGRAFYVREITRKIDEQINSVRRELANMLNVGIIKSESSDNRLYYEVNQEYLNYEPLRQIFTNDKSASKIIESVDTDYDWGKRLKALGDVRIAVLSGKLVHGSDSEVDMLLAGSINKTQAKRLIKALEEEEHKTLNYVVMDYQDFYYRLSIKDRFVMSIINTKYTVVADTEQVLG